MYNIYDLLGIKGDLQNLVIPQDIFLQNLQNPKLYLDATQYFKVIDQIVLRASVSRGAEELQVLEISLKESKHLSEISALIQTAVKYRVLFVFIYAPVSIRLRG